MPTTVIFIGDPHIQVENIPEVDLFLEKLIKLVKEKLPDIIIIAGDILHTHERLHTVALNKAYELIDQMRKISKTYLLVGNHDMCNNSQFLTPNHWMNGLKEWNNVIVVDTVISEIINRSKTIIWSGPVGYFEKKPFDKGTDKIASLINSKKSLISIAGGGDTVAALKKNKKIKNFSYLSTGGGAFLHWLEKFTLPGIEALKK